MNLLKFLGIGKLKKIKICPFFTKTKFYGVIALADFYLFIRYEAKIDVSVRFIIPDNNANDGMNFSVHGEVIENGFEKR